MTNTATMMRASDCELPFWNSSHTNLPRPGFWASISAAVLLVFQAWLGKETVRLGNSGESVTAHLASAMALVGLLVWILARSLYPARLAGGGSQRFTLVAAFGAGSVFAPN